MKKELTYDVEILEGVEVSLEGKTLIVKGEKGENKNGGKRRQRKKEPLIEKH